METVKKTEEIYSFLWEKNQNISLPNSWHFNVLQEIIDEPIVRGLRGIDVGSGAGYDTYVMAKDNPDVEIVSIDLSDGVFVAKKINFGLKNVRIIKCSVIDMSLKNDIFDFAYSFGVLHHAISPKKGLSEIARILKKGSPVFLYVYEDHRENLIKYTILKVVAMLRRITTKIPPRILYLLCWILSPIVFMFFSFPGIIVKKFNATRDFSNKLPFNFAKRPFSLQGDLYDRFSAPVEYRFSKEELCSLFKDCGFMNIKIRKLNDRAGWVAIGYKGEY